MRGRKSKRRSGHLRRIDKKDPLNEGTEKYTAFLNHSLNVIPIKKDPLNKGTETHRTTALGVHTSNIKKDPLNKGTENTIALLPLDLHCLL